VKLLRDEIWNDICQYLDECLFPSNNKDRDSATIAVKKALMWHTNDCREFFYASRFRSQRYWLLLRISWTQGDPSQ
jgi:hypothetical protein